MKRLLIMVCVAFLGIGVTWGQYYEPVIKPTMDSISWKAWSRNTEEDVVTNISSRLGNNQRTTNLHMFDKRFEFQSRSM